VKLRAKEVVSEEKKNLIQQNIETIQVKGFPNCFGSQRFGKKNKNFWEAKGLMEAGLSHSSSFHSQ
jgi:tRNA(Glu) U13 pseudouridine synthase TruD